MPHRSSESVKDKKTTQHSKYCTQKMNRTMEINISGVVKEQLQTHKNITP